MKSFPLFRAVSILKEAAENSKEKYERGECMSIHDGHRQRLKDRFLREGLDNFDDLYVLELLLYYTISRKDTNPIAHAL